MALIGLSVSQVMRYKYATLPNGEFVVPNTRIFVWDTAPYLAPFSKEDTYMLIFDKAQYKDALACLKSRPEFEIIYESVPAFNRNHPGQSANTVVMFELKELPDESVAQPLPQVPTKRKG
jgi:hypothetical protein